MNAKEAIENYKKMFHEFESIITGIDSANSFDELAPYEKKVLKAAYALRVSQNQAIVAVSNLASARRNYLRHKPVEKPVEKNHVIEKKPVEKSTRARVKKVTRKAKK